MNHESLSSIETITTDSEEFVSVSSHGVAAIPLNDNDEQVNESAPGDGFFKSIMFIGLEHCDAIREAFHGSFRLKIKGFLMCILLPFSIILTPFRRTCSQKRKVTQIAIVYFYVFMTCSIVLNLWVQLEPHNNAKEKESSYRALQYFEAAMMGLTLIPIICIAFETYGRVEWKSYDKVLVFYFQLGLYFFGISSFVYSFLKMCNAWSCGKGLSVLVYACKFVFILSQIMFLSYFYQAKLPSRDWKLQLSLAHIMVTNLSLWIWVVCKEVYDPFDDTKPMDCQAIHLSHTEKYFYPLFIEYLLIVAGMVYELWSDMKVPYQTQRGAVRLHHTEENHDRESESNSNLSLRTILPRDIRRDLCLAATFVSAAILCCTFISRLLASADSADHDKKWYLYFIYANIVFYISQIAACYVIKVCSQSQPFNSKRTKLNIDDSLLYFGLAGIVLWNAFHFYHLVVHADKDSKAIELFNNLLGILEDFAQTVILVSVRRLSSRGDGNAQTIKNMSLFLLATNLTFWFQNSFLIKKELKNPGEKSDDLLNTYADILNPLTIFFRFHSATCSYYMWVIFSKTDSS